jgi:hypothetical protein
MVCEADMGRWHMSSGTVTDSLSWVEGSSTTSATRMAKWGMAVVDTPRRHLSAPQSQGAQNIEGGGWKDLQEDVLVQCSHRVV